MKKLKTTIALIVFSNLSIASEEKLDLEFIEWLGQVSEAQEQGMDVDTLLEVQEKAPQSNVQELAE